MSPLTWTILISTLSTSTIITMVSHHWLLAWLGLELNTLSILPLIIKPHHPRTTEATTKYFLVQTMAAALILFASTLNAWQTGNWDITLTASPIATTIIMSALLFKMGIAPAHLWYPDIIQGTTLPTALIISTWQKLAPLTLLYMTIHHMSSTLLLLSGATSVALGSWAGLNQTQTRKIMAFSSIAHMGWLITALTINPHLATLTLLIYLLLTTTMFLTLITTTTKTLQDLGTNWSASPQLFTATTATLMSLGGLPPFTGFTPKLLILKELSLASLPTLGMTLALLSLPSLYFYTRMAYLTILTAPPQTNSTKLTWRFKMNMLMSPPLIIPLTTMLLPTTPLLYTYL
uniref:NADH-ubiquinone oxidoreductase chain 2 n=1 Tax=Pachydactylus wahlbergii TaxID=202839 RepID=J7GDM2_9SAUR|nr:NADH dehydrogenase subunit 2 [Pachydactylus wahlbergii]